MKTLSLLSIATLALVAGFAAMPAQAQGTPKMGVAIYKFDDTFMSYVRNAISANASGKANLEIVDCQNSQPTEDDQIDQFLAKKMGAILINPVDRTAASGIIDKAKAHNTPVVFFNREPMPEDMKKWDKVYYVGAKAEQSGLMQGQIAVDYFKAHPKAFKAGDKTIHYIMLKGEPGHQDAELRTKFSVQAITEAGIKVNCLAEDTANWDRPKAVEKMKTFLAKFGDKIDLVLANNDDMALGAIEALRQEGYNTGNPAKYIPVVGVDATAPALQALEQGTLLGTVLNDAKNQGKATYDLGYALATGKPVTSTTWKITDGKYVWVPYAKVTIENYKQYK